MAVSHSQPQTLSEIRRLFLKNLPPLYGQREAQSLTRLCFSEITGSSGLQLQARADMPLPPENIRELQRVLAGLQKQEPVQYLLGHTWFFDLKLKTDKRALIPRPETEELVSKIVTRNSLSTPAVLDIGTGSGAIALALKSVLPGAEVYAADVSTDALELVRENAALTGLQIHPVQIDILREDLNSLPVSQWDIIVSNPPYVTFAERQQMQPNVLAHEPHLALFVEDDDPLLFYRTIALQAQRYLKPGGWLYFEINEAYGAELEVLLKEMKFADLTIEQDLTGRDRFVIARK